MLEHVDAHDPPTLVHGDLLGQNILRRFDGDSPSFGVIDWEYAQVGDPAHDLAILTRGSQRPFGVPDGLPRLLDAYNARGKIPLGRADVRFFELALTVSVYADMLEAEGPHTPPGHVLRTIARLVKQAAAWG